MLFTCLTIFISFIIIPVLSKFHLTCMGSPKVKNCDQRLESTAQGRKPRAAFSSLRLTSLFFFPSVNRLEFVYATVSGSESAYVPSTNDS